MILIVLGFLILVSVLGTTGNDSKENTAENVPESTKSTVYSAEQTGSLESTSENATENIDPAVFSTETTESPDNTESAAASTPVSPEPLVYGVGETGTKNDISVTLNSAEVTDTLDLFGFPTNAADGKEYLILNWRVVNNSDSSFMVTQGSFKSYVDNATADVSGSSYMIDDVFNSDLSLEPGRETSGSIIYEVPIGWQLFETSIDTAFFGHDSIDFQVTPYEVY